MYVNRVSTENIRLQEITQNSLILPLLMPMVTLLISIPELVNMLVCAQTFDTLLFCTLLGYIDICHRAYEHILNISHD